MANEDGSEDRLTKNEFAELIQHLSVQEILTIEYRIGTVWNKLFARKNYIKHIFFCNLCILETSSFNNLLAHIDGRKHKLQMERVDQLYHQDYTYPKNNNKMIPNDGDKLGYIGEKNSTTKVKAVIQNKSDACLKSLIENETQSEKDRCDEVCVIESEEDSTTSSKVTVENQAKYVQQVVTKHGGQSKLNEKMINPKAISKEPKKAVTNVSEKRSLEESKNDKEVDLKKRKLVVNPAAALSLKASTAITKESESEESNKKQPEYQKDRIIIPTAHKYQTHDEKTSPTVALKIQADATPKFAVKSYSSKPSDNDVHGILGVEYVIKILKHRNDVSPRYECGLCELVLDGFAMQRHLEGYNHRLKFCEKHFPTAIRQYRQYMQTVPEGEIFKVMAPVLAKLAQAIEQHHGRNLPYECYERDFSMNRHEILAKAFSCRHASEQYGPTFTHVVGSKEIDEFINNKHRYLPPPFSRTAIFDSKPGITSDKTNNRHQNSRNSGIEPDSGDRSRHADRENVSSDRSTHRSFMSSGLHEDMYPRRNPYMQADDRSSVQPVDDETYKLMVDDFLKGTLKGSCRKTSFRDTRKCSSSPVKNLSSDMRKSLSPLRQNDIWQAYRHMVDQELYNLDERFKQYRKEPESHPSYNDEWQKFWKRRKDELVSAGLDHRKYNYQPEWVRFVKIRIEELYGQEVENLKIKSRERLFLPMSNEHIKNEKYHVKSQQTSNEKSVTEHNSQQGVDIAPSLNSSQTPQNTKPQVVSVLRLMTALEDSLGSLGPKIIDLLSKALQTEKVNPLYVNAIILNDDNCSLIETAKEKLKGLLITGLFEGSKKKVLNQVVNDAEALLFYAYQFKKELGSQRSVIESSTSQPQNPSFLSLETHSGNAFNALKNQSVISNMFNKTPQSSSSSLTDNLLTNVDKKELASKLAASLVAQGKTDFDPAQLHQLITVYKLIEKKKRETAGTAVLPNKSSLQVSANSSKKALSDTLSDLLRPSPSSEFPTSTVRNISNASRGATEISNFDTRSSDVPEGFGNNAPSNSFTSVQQNPSDNFFNSAVRSTTNAFGANSSGNNHFSHRSDYGMNYNNPQPNQQNFNMMYSNQFQNSGRMSQHWGRITNLSANQNYNMSNPNNSLNQSSNWQNF